LRELKKHEGADLNRDIEEVVEARIKASHATLEAEV
jgi:hypothetical protein